MVSSDLCDRSSDEGRRELSKGERELRRVAPLVRRISIPEENLCLIVPVFESSITVAPPPRTCPSCIANIL